MMTDDNYLLESKSENPASFREFPIRFADPQGRKGLHELKVELFLIAGIHGDLLTMREAANVQCRARARGYVTRLVKWYTPSGKFSGYLIYGRPFQEIWQDNRVDRRLWSTGGSAWDKSPMGDTDFFTELELSDVVYYVGNPPSDRRIKKSIKKVANRFTTRRK